MKEVTRFFDGVTMPETCAEGIRQALETGIRAKQKGYAMMKSQQPERSSVPLPESWPA